MRRTIRKFRIDLSVFPTYCPGMESLNYHHLLYFWMVAREGGLAKAAAKLRLAHPTVSGQVKVLEEALGEKLFRKEGRRLVLTEMGQVVFGYADAIFTLGRELQDAVKGRPTGQPLRLVVGIADVVPKLIAKRLLEPARQLAEPVRIICREDKADRLFAELVAHRLDVVLCDAPVRSGSGVRAFNHLLGECGVSIFATTGLAARYRPGFPGSLDGAPMLLPTETTTLRQTLDQWFDAHHIRPRVEAEFDDSALMKVFGSDGVGLFPAPTAIDQEVQRQYGVELVGQLTDLRERFYAVSIERRLKHPAVVAMWKAAHEQRFKSAVG